LARSSSPLWGANSRAIVAPTAENRSCFSS
jgi:hypothetical protein